MSSIYKADLASEKELKDQISLIVNLISKKSIILLFGDLSAGKTTFVSLFCDYLNLTMIQSPTYAIHQRYSNSTLTVDHFDLYRLENEDQIESSGFYDLLNTPADYKFIEWPERLNRGDLPMDEKIYKIILNKTGENSRTIEILKLN